MHNKYHIKAEAIIHAPIAMVWKVMTDVKNYPEWNSFIKKIESKSEEPVEGTLMKFKVELKKGKITGSNELVKLLSAPKEKNGVLEAEWIYDFTGPLHNIGMVMATRSQKLVQLKNGTTHYYTCEKFSGWGKVFLPLANVQAGFIKHAADLKEHCEK